MDKHYISGFNTRTALPRNKRLREAGAATAVPAASIDLSGYALASDLASLAVTVESNTERISSLEDLFEIDPITGAIRTKNDRPFYSNSWISAYGAGSGGSGGGGVSIMNSWDAYSPTDSSQVLGSALAMSLHDDVEALKNASTEVNWVTPEPSSGNEAGIDIRGTSKTLLKSSAIDYPAKVVGLISENEYLGALNTFFPTGTTS